MPWDVWPWRHTGESAGASVVRLLSQAHEGPDCLSAPSGLELVCGRARVSPVAATCASPTSEAPPPLPELVWRGRRKGNTKRVRPLLPDSVLPLSCCQVAVGIRVHSVVCTQSGATVAAFPIEQSARCAEM